jgi:hypothetical protein
MQTSRRGIPNRNDPTVASLEALAKELDGKAGAAEGERRQIPPVNSGSEASRLAKLTPRVHTSSKGASITSIVHPSLSRMLISASPPVRVSSYNIQEPAHSGLSGKWLSARPINRPSRTMSPLIIRRR